MLDIKTILAESVKNKASDIHINVTMSPIASRNTELLDMDFPVVSAENAKQMGLSMVGPARFDIF